MFLSLSLLSDREGHGHKAVVYKSHFPPLRHSVVTETPADTLANKPRLTKDTHSLFFMPPRHGGSSDLNWDLRTINLGCVTHCQSIERMERSLRDSLFTLWLPALSFMQNKCAFQWRPLHHGQQGTAGGSWQGTHLVSGCMLSDYNNQGISHSVSNSSR